MAERAAAIVGTCAATAYGEHVAAELAAGLAERDAAVVSGGAYGIDGAAHRAARNTLGDSTMPEIGTYTLPVILSFRGIDAAVNKELGQAGLALALGHPADNASTDVRVNPSGPVVRTGSSGRWW